MLVNETHTLNVPQGLPLTYVRARLRSVDGHLPDRGRETLALLVTELVSNGVRHGEPPVELEVTWLAGTARLVVRSRGPAFRWHGPPSPGQEEDGVSFASRGWPTGGASGALAAATRCGSKWTTRWRFVPVAVPRP